MSIEDIKNCECISFETLAPMDNIDSAEWFKENILPDEAEIILDDGNYFEVCVWKVKSFHVIFMVMEISIIMLLILIF